MIEQRPSYLIPIALVISILATRYVISTTLGIHPDQSYIYSHWQHLSIEALNSDFWSEIYNLHSQSPFWNVILGAYVNFCNGDIDCITHVGFSANLVITIIVSLLLNDVLKKIGFGQNSSALLSFTFSILPSTIYYENYIFYPHATLFFASLSLYFSLYYQIAGRNIYFCAALISLTLLSWTWGIFHPLIILFAGGLMMLMAAPVSASRIFAFTLFGCLLFLPSAKNQVEFGFWGNSSWLGLNVSQVAPERAEGCDFPSFRQTLPDIQHGGTAYNHPSIIPYAEACLHSAVSSVISDPISYVNSTLYRMMVSTSLTSADYFFPPKGFWNYPRWVGNAPVRLDNGDVYNRGVLVRLTTIVFHSIVFLFVIVAPLRAKKKFKSAATIFTILFCIVFFVGHLANGGEQERFRYSLNSALFLYVVVICVALIREIKSYIGGLLR